MNTYINKPSRTEKQMIFLKLLGMNDAKITTDSNTFSMADIGSLELLVLFVSQIGHGAFEL